MSLSPRAGVFCFSVSAHTRVWRFAREPLEDLHSVRGFGGARGSGKSTLGTRVRCCTRGTLRRYTLGMWVWGSRGSALKIYSRNAGLGVHAGLKNLRWVHGFGAARERRFAGLRSVRGFGGSRGSLLLENLRSVRGFGAARERRSAGLRSVRGFWGLRRAP